MDFMKVLDQTVREIKREVNIKVLKVPEIEQKVLDATSDEPWGPHGSDLAELAHATKKFNDCQLVMNVLWTRLTEGGRNWRHAYKALAVIEYLVAHGSERAVDDVIEHSFQISSLSGFEFVEPNGKDMGINVRKKAETIISLLNDKSKIQEVRNKAAANRDKYVGLSSTGITNKSTSASYGGSSFQHSDRYGGVSAKKDGEIFRDSYRDRDHFGENEFSKDSREKSRRGVAVEDEGNNVKKGSKSYSRDQDALSSGTLRPSSKLNNSDDNYGPIPSQSSGAPNGPEDDFDDFDPRGTSSAGAATASVNQVDLLGDLMDAPVAVPSEMSATNGNATTEVDLFADADFVSASPHVEAGVSSQTQANADLFASQSTFPSASSSTVDFFAAPDPVQQTAANSRETDPISSHTVDPFAAVPLNSFDGSDDLFGAFTSNSDQVSTQHTQNSAKEGNLDNLNQKPSTESNAPPKKATFQVKSGIWADSLNRGLIDLNITAPKKTNLADIGIVGGLSDGSGEKEKLPPTSFYMGRAMGTGSGLGKSGFTSSAGASGVDDVFSNLSQPQQFGSFKK